MMQNAVVLLYLAGGSFVACFLGEYQFAMILILTLTNLFIFILYDAKVLTLHCFYFGGFQRVIVGQELVKDKLLE